MKQQINEIKRMQQLAGIITESQLNEAVSISGDYNNMDFDGSDQEDASSYLKTTEGKKAVTDGFGSL